VKGKLTAKTCKAFVYKKFISALLHHHNAGSRSNSVCWHFGCWSLNFL